MTMKTALAATLCAALLGASAVAGDLETARKLYEQAKTEADPGRKMKLLQDSLAQSDTFEARLALGEALDAQGRHADARRELQKASETAANEKGRARATYLMGESLLAEGNEQEAIATMRRSLQIFDFPQVRERIKEIELLSIDKPVDAAAITAALDTTKKRAFGVKPAVSLRIQFDLNKATFNASGRTQAEQLGQALKGMAGKRFEIVGHTDKQGNDAYNDKLSLQRAETVKAFLTASYGINAANLTVVGKGKRELLYPGDSQQEHALNRRVDVVVKE